MNNKISLTMIVNFITVSRDVSSIFIIAQKTSKCILIFAWCFCYRIQSVRWARYCRFFYTHFPCNKKTYVSINNLTRFFSYQSVMIQFTESGTFAPDFVSDIFAFTSWTAFIFSPHNLTLCVAHVATFLAIVICYSKVHNVTTFQQMNNRQTIFLR